MNLDELAEKARGLASPTNACDGCDSEMPGVRAPILPDCEDSHAFVETCDGCRVYDTDQAAAEAIAARLGLTVHKRYDDATLLYWRPFLTEPGDEDDSDFYGVDPNEFGCWPKSEVRLP